MYFPGGIRLAGRLAVVGDARWQKGITVFTGAEVRYFEMADIEKAREWIRE
jgi:hypothetical protein